MTQPINGNPWDAIKACSLGTRIMASIPRNVANDVLRGIRENYGPLGGFSNTFHQGVTYLLFERPLPNISDVLANDARFKAETNHEGHIFLSSR